MHVHRAIDSERQLQLSGPVPGLDVQLCDCGNVFRLNGCQDWITMRSLPKPDEVDFKEACRILCISNSSLFMLMKLSIVRGERRHIPGKREQWRFKETQLRKLRRRLAKRVR